MTEFYPEQQSTNLPDSSTLITNSTMPSFYPPSTRHRTVLTKQLTDRDDVDDHDQDSIYKEAFIIQFFQHWKIKTLEHQQAMANSTNHFVSAGQKTETISDVETTVPQISTNENKTDEIVSTVQPAIRKRVTPLRRKDPLKKTVSLPIESSNPNLLVPDPKTKVRSNVQKKVAKPGPIFIAPKKTQPSGIPRGYSFYGSDDVNSIKRRSPIDDEHHHHSNRSFPLSIACCIDDDDDDGTSSDDSHHESLLLRNRSAMKKPVVFKQNYTLPSHVIIPTAIMVTDPCGHSHSYDIDHEYNNGSKSNEDNLDKYTLHSIGEEDEETIEKNNQNGIILSKELDRIEAFTRSRQTSSETDRNEESETKPLGRRWSEGGVSDEDEQNPSPSLVKTTSTASVIKQNNSQPTKISKTKYLLMKLHLTSSSKDEESNNSTVPPQRKRVVRRSSDKKHSNQALQTSIDESRHSLSTSQHLQSNNSIHLENVEQQKANVVIDINQTPHVEPLQQRQSATESEDDIDTKFRKAKMGSQFSLNSTISENKARYDLDVNGTIQLKLSYNINIGALDIFIGNCYNLTRNKRGQSINPYCKLYLLPDKSKSSKRKSTIKKNINEPIFNETFRYYLTLQEFDLRTLSISVWSQSTLSQNDFLGELQIPLARCSLDKLEDYKLLSHTKDENIPIKTEPLSDTTEIQFDLSFIEHHKNQNIGTIQVNHIYGKGICQDRPNIDLICKGNLLPDKSKRKIQAVRKGPSPKWDIPLRWENIRRENLKTLSLEISIWSQERFRKTSVGYIQLNVIPTKRRPETEKFFNITIDEQTIWKTFCENPWQIHRVRLPLRLVND